MRFVSFEEAGATFRGKRVAIVGSAPSVLKNAAGHVDSHDVVVRVNNYKLGEAQGLRADVHYAFYGHSIKKAASDLKMDGVKLCICKCPNSKPLDSEWHERHGRTMGIDFRYIYEAREPFWFCDTYVPDNERFMSKFELLGRHIPTTGFSAILDVLDWEPAQVYLTGFDFFRSGVHNVNETWRAGSPEDPIGHLPEREALWLARNLPRHPVSVDRPLRHILQAVACA